MYLCIRWGELAACMLSMNSGSQSWAFFFFHLGAIKKKIEGRINYLAGGRNLFLGLYFLRWPLLTPFSSLWFVLPAWWGRNWKLLGEDSQQIQAVLIVLPVITCSKPYSWKKKKKKRVHRIACSYILCDICEVSKPSTCQKGEVWTELSSKSHAVNFVSQET